MSDLSLPLFKYHPDPVSSGSIVVSEVKCRACNQYRGDELDRYMESLDKDAGPTAYAFRCRICGAWGGYSDMH
jgi:uncharacterized protein CbrC (UPF0167 family)